MALMWPSSYIRRLPAFDDYFDEFMEDDPIFLSRSNRHKRSPGRRTFLGNRRVKQLPATSANKRLRLKRKLADDVLSQWVRIVQTGELDPRDVNVRLEDDRIVVDGEHICADGERIFMRRELPAPRNVEWGKLRVIICAKHAVILLAPFVKEHDRRKGTIDLTCDADMDVLYVSDGEDVPLTEPNSVDSESSQKESSGSASQELVVNHRPTTDETDSTDNGSNTRLNVSEDQSECNRSEILEESGSVSTLGSHSKTTDKTNQKKPVSIKVNVGNFTPGSMKVQMKGRAVTLRALQEERDHGSRYSQQLVHQVLLPDDVDTGSIRCCYGDDGTLTLTAQRAEKTPSREQSGKA